MQIPGLLYFYKLLSNRFSIPFCKNQASYFFICKRMTTCLYKVLLYNEILLTVNAYKKYRIKKEYILYHLNIPMRANTFQVAFFAEI